LVSPRKKGRIGQTAKPGIMGDRSVCDRDLSEWKWSDKLDEEGDRGSPKKQTPAYSAASLARVDRYGERLVGCNASSGWCYPGTRKGGKDGAVEGGKKKGSHRVKHGSQR